jgi:hypothetical protein
MQLKEISQALGKLVPSVSNRITRIGIARDKKEPVWTTEDIHFLRENWGKLGPRVLAKRLGRTDNSILVKCKRLKLGPIQDKSLFDKRDICELLAIDHRKVDKWLQQNLLKSKIAPTSREHGKSRNILQVKPQDLVDFLRDNPDQWDARKSGDIRRAINQKELLKPKVEIQRTEGVQRKRRIPGYLIPAFAKFVADGAVAASDQIKEGRRGMDWLQEKKRQDLEGRLPREGFRWTPEEDERLRRLFRRGEMTDRRIGLALGRSEAAIRHRLMRIRETIWDVAIGIQEKVV